ncbi:hypothetical protein [Flammeovirga sp. SJP92]|uniref:hypothetical protein n=1 Tax=Flammeovirga sp. SJP92 TaxID=1775430 RepID=UPI0012FBE792|nr:hypothetical protein [Flammeovirga sp. SJP92]
MPLKTPYVLSFLILMLMGCQPKKMDQSEINKNMLSKAQTVLKSDNVQIIPNDKNTYYLCFTKSENMVKQKLSYIVLDPKENIIVPVKTLIDGNVSWLDENHIKTSQKMGIAQQGASNVIRYSIDVTTGNTTKL